MSTVSIRRCGVCKLSGHNSRTCPSRALQAAIRLAEQTAQSLAARGQELQEGTTQAAQAQPASQTPAPQPAASPVPHPNQKPDLGLLSIGARQVFVSLLPSQAESVIVKYQPEIQVSCVIPPQKFPISYAFSRSTNRKRKLDITTPTLIMSCGYGDVPTPRTYKRVLRPYTLWVIDTQRKNKIYGKPYLFANVYESGKICFGNLQPSSLRQAYNYYWTSSFNAELYRVSRVITHSCNNKAHTLSFHNGHRCDPTKKIHTCACPRITFHQHRQSDGVRGGCGCRNVGKSKSCRGACDNSQTSSCDCCRAIQAVQAEARLADPNIGQRKLSKLAVVEGRDYPGCGCTYRHKRGCNCTYARCACECHCACCTETCSHETCVCSCCTSTCDCRCNCSADDRFGIHLQVYHEKLMPNQKWKNRTDLFCGTKFWAAPKAGFGVIMSNDKVLLRQIPRKFWRKDKNDQALVIALANKKSEGGWAFESGGFTFELSDENVMAR